MHNTKKLFFISTFILGFMPCVKPLSETAKNVFAVGSGACVCVATGVLVNNALLEANPQGTHDVPMIIGGVSGLAAGGITWYLVDAILFNFTPPGRVLNAAKIIAKAEENFFLGKKILTEREIIEGAYAGFMGNWPLVLAREDILQVSIALNNASEQLELAYEEASGQYQYTELCKKCQKLKNKLVDLKERIAFTVTVIAKDPDYKEQARLFERHMEAERQRSHEAYLQMSQQAHESWEKHREEKFKEKMVDKVNQPGRPTMINVSI